MRLAVISATVKTRGSNRWSANMSKLPSDCNNAICSVPLRSKIKDPTAKLTTSFFCETVANCSDEESSSTTLPFETKNASRSPLISFKTRSVAAALKGIVVGSPSAFVAPSYMRRLVPFSSLTPTSNLLNALFLPNSPTARAVIAPARRLLLVGKNLLFHHCSTDRSSGLREPQRSRRDSRMD